MAEPRHLTSILEVLLTEDVSFVLVGALAAVAQGAPLTTHDVDIVHARTPENVERLMSALGKLNARHRRSIAGEPAASGPKGARDDGPLVADDRSRTARLPRSDRGWP
jgi:hypothetical protein